MATTMLRSVAVGLGLVVGAAVALTSAHRGEPLWAVWASLAVALTGTAGAVFGYGVAAWADLRALHPVRVRDVAVPSAVLGSFALALFVFGLVIPADGASDGAALRGGVLTSTSALGAVPAVATMYGIRCAAAAEGSLGERVDRLVALRRLLQRLLAAVGSLVVLSTLALGAAFTLAPTGPPQVVLLFGGAGSLLVGLAYAPASTALQHYGQALSDEQFPLREVTEPAEVLVVADNRQRLEQFLGVQRSLFADLQSGLAILAPLLASAATAFLPN